MANDPMQNMANMLNQIAPAFSQRPIYCQFCGKPILGLSDEFSGVPLSDDPAIQQLELSKRAHVQCSVRSAEKKNAVVKDTINADIAIFERLPDAEKERLFEAGSDPYTKHGLQP